MAIPVFCRVTTILSRFKNRIFRYTQHTSQCTRLFSTDQLQKTETRFTAAESKRSAVVIAKTVYRIVATNKGTSKAAAAAYRDRLLRTKLTSIRTSRPRNEILYSGPAPRPADKGIRFVEEGTPARILEAINLPPSPSPPPPPTPLYLPPAPSFFSIVPFFIPFPAFFNPFAPEGKGWKGRLF